MFEQWRWRRGFAPLPPGIDFLLTYDCNLRCEYCPRSRHGFEHLSPAAKMMDTDSMLAIADQVAEFGTWIRIIGGEPLLHPHWDLLTRRVTDRGMWAAMVSNGTAVGRLAERLVDSGLRVLAVSLDGPEGIHDAGRGSGTFRQIVDGLERLHRVKEARGSELPLITVYTTIVAGNHHLLADFAAELETWKIWKFHLQQLIWTSERRFRKSVAMLRAQDSGLELFGPEEHYIDSCPSGVDGRVLAAQLDLIKQRELPYILEINPDLPSHDMEPFHTDDEYERSTAAACTCMESYAFIDPAGRLLPCMSIDMGNVFEKPFVKVWNNRRFRAFRRLVRSHGRLPCCHRCPD